MPIRIVNPLTIVYRYYYPRKNARPNIVPCSKEAKEVLSRRSTSSKSQSGSAEQKVKNLPDFLTGVVVYFTGIPDEERKKLRRYVIAYPFSKLLLILTNLRTMSIYLSSKTSYTLRDSENKLAIPKPPTNYLKIALVTVVRPWNGLPVEL